MVARDRGPVQPKESRRILLGYVVGWVALGLRQLLMVSVPMVVLQAIW